MKARDSAHVYSSRINRVIDHIRAHIDEPLPLERLARIAHFSPFHFHRIFHAMTGESLHSLVRRLRLERAVFQMLHGPQTTLTRIALACGFASSSDFSRAFKQVYGFPPRRCSRAQLQEHSKIRQDLLANAGYGFGKLPDGNPDRFRVRLVDRPALRIAYVRVIGGYDATMLRAGFDRLMTWGRARGIMPGATLIGMSCDAPEVTPMKNTHFDWCMVLPSGFEADRRVDVGMIPANRFAIVRMRGDLHKEDRAWNYLFHSWLPRSGYEPTPGPALEVYRRTPLELGWSEFDMDCYLPVKPLRS